MNQCRRKVKTGTQLHLSFRHLSVILFMIVAGHVQHSVEEQDFELLIERMAVYVCIFLRDLQADRDIAAVSSRERKHVSRAVLATKAAI